MIRLFKRLQTLLEENPNPDLYIQAALLSASKTKKYFGGKQLSGKGL